MPKEWSNVYKLVLREKVWLGMLFKYKGTRVFANLKIQGLWQHLDNEKTIKSQVESIKVIIKKSVETPKLK